MFLSWGMYYNGVMAEGVVGDEAVRMTMTLESMGL